MIQNRIYSWLLEVIAQHSRQSERVLGVLTLAAAVGGLELERLREQEPDLASEACVILREVALEIAAGVHVLTDYDGTPCGEMQTQCRESFGRLAEMLRHWEAGQDLPGDERAGGKQ